MSIPLYNNNSIIHISHSLYKTCVAPSAIAFRIASFTYHIVYIKPSSKNLKKESIELIHISHSLYKTERINQLKNMITVIHISHSLYKTRLVTQKKPYRKTIHISHSLYKTRPYL